MPRKSTKVPRPSFLVEGRGLGTKRESSGARAVESPTEISRDFICKVTSSAWDYLAKSGQDGWLERSGDGASLGQEY